jgi:hypothetical protein
MPFRKGYEGVYDQATLDRLQDILECIWLAIVDAGQTSVAREDVARMIISAYDSGMKLEVIGDSVIAEIGERESS